MSIINSQYSFAQREYPFPNESQHNYRGAIYPPDSQLFIEPQTRPVLRYQDNVYTRTPSPRRNIDQVSITKSILDQPREQYIHENGSNYKIREDVIIRASPPRDYQPIYDRNRYRQLASSQFIRDSHGYMPNTDDVQVLRNDNIRQHEQIVQQTRAIRELMALIEKYEWQMKEAKTRLNVQYEKYPETWELERKSMEIEIQKLKTQLENERKWSLNLAQELKKYESDPNFSKYQKSIKPLKTSSHLNYSQENSLYLNQYEPTNSLKRSNYFGPAEYKYLYNYNSNTNYPTKSDILITDFQKIPEIGNTQNTYSPYKQDYPDSKMQTENQQQPNTFQHNIGTLSNISNLPSVNTSGYQQSYSNYYPTTMHAPQSQPNIPTQSYYKERNNF